jgi:multidrug efflux pump subunit AcrA (membrane-fusion protein)
VVKFLVLEEVEGNERMRILFAFRGGRAVRRGFICLGICVALAGLGAGLTAATGWGPRPAPAESEPSIAPEAGPAVVETVRPRRQTVRFQVREPGQIQGYEQTPLFSKIAGYIKVLNADIGDTVRRGQVLAELGVPELEEDLHQKEAAVTLARAQVTQARRAFTAARASFVKAQAALKQAEAGLTRTLASQARWQAEYERTRKLLPTRAVTQQDADQVYDQAKSAEAALAESRAAIQLAAAARDESAALRDQAEANVRVAEAKVRVAEADRRHAAAILEYSRVRAPCDGVVTTRPLDTGHLVQPATGASAGGPPLFIVVRTDPVRVFVDVPETAAALVRPGTPARVRVQALGEQEFVGRVKRFSWVLDNRTRTLHTQIDLPNPAGRLRPGMYVAAVLELERPGAWTVPAGAVFEQDDQTLIACALGGRVRRLPVRLGMRQGDRVEVIRKQTRPARPGSPAVWEDFTGREDVVAHDPAALADGQPVGRPAAGQVARRRPASR